LERLSVLSESIKIAKPAEQTSKSAEFLQLAKRSFLISFGSIVAVGMIVGAIKMKQTADAKDNSRAVYTKVTGTIGALPHSAAKMR
jgi:hypothetical protein